MRRIRQSVPNAGCNAGAFYPAYNERNILIYMVLYAGCNAGAFYPAYNENNILIYMVL